MQDSQAIAMYTNSHAHLTTHSAGTNPVQLTRGMDKTVTALVKELAALSTEVASDKDLANVAAVSAGRAVGAASSAAGMYIPAKHSSKQLLFVCSRIQQAVNNVNKVAVLRVSLVPCPITRRW